MAGNEISGARWYEAHTCRSAGGEGETERNLGQAWITNVFSCLTGSGLPLAPYRGGLAH